MTDCIIHLEMELHHPQSHEQENMVDPYSRQYSFGHPPVDQLKHELLCYPPLGPNLLAAGTFLALLNVLSTNKHSLLLKIDKGRQYTRQTMMPHYDEKPNEFANHWEQQGMIYQAMDDSSVMTATVLGMFFHLQNPLGYGTGPQLHKFFHFLHFTLVLKVAYDIEQPGCSKLLLRARKAPPGLVKHGVDLVAFLHLKLVRGLLTTEPTTIKQESNGVEIHRLTVAVGVHQLLQLCGSLDPEEHLIAVLQNKRGISVKNQALSRHKLQ